MVKTAEDKAADYLAFYGYLKAAKDNFQEAVKLFQFNFGVFESDGQLGPKTLRAMDTPRCGVADNLEIEGVTAKWPDRDWKTNPLTYRVEKWLDGVSQSEQRGTFIKAWESWEQVCGIQLKETGGSSADITISVGRGRGDGFDGPSGTLAWAQLPGGGGGKLLMRFDVDESWNRSVQLLNVAAHEFGHLLGLSHLSQPGQLMNPFYAVGIYSPQRYDIEEAQKRYGKPTKPTVPPVGDGYVLRVATRDALTIDGCRITKIA